jgi:hypothetical protein
MTLRSFLHVSRIELRVQDEVRKNVEGNRKMFVEHLGAVANRLLGGEGVQMPTNRVDLTRDFFGCTV